MKLLRAFTVCLLLISSFAAWSRDKEYSDNDLIGVWEGYLHIVVDGKPVRFAFALEIRNKGNGTYGDQCSLTIKVDNVEYYITTTITGYMSGNDFVFSDKDVQESTDPPNASGFYWCAKSGKLHLAMVDGKTTLIGPVSGYSPRGNCFPSTAELWKRGQ